ncbi:CBS domain-containing protein [soil metagenome]
MRDAADAFDGDLNIQVKNLMTLDPICYTPDSSLVDAAKLMVDFDCGKLPVDADMDEMKPVGVITDRDITCRTVAESLNPIDMKVGDCMTTPVVSLMGNQTLDDCYRVLEENQVRRVPVVNVAGRCVGTVSLGDIARDASPADSGKVSHEVCSASISAPSA